MTQEGLTNEIMDALEQGGFKAYYGVENKLNNIIKVFPAAWLSPLKLMKTSGVYEGTQTFHGLLKLLTKDPKAAQNQNKTWSLLHEQWFDMTKTLMSKPHVINVSGIKIIPAALSLTNQGEISINVEFDIETYFSH